jgi:hypothetical protein
VASASISLITRCGIGHPSQPREMLGAELAELAGDRLGRPAGALADRALGPADLAPLGGNIVEKPASDASPAGRGAVALRRAVERPFALGQFASDKIPAEAVHAARVDRPPGNEHPRFGEKASRLQFGDGRADRVRFW